VVREYAKVSPRLWTGSLGKALRGDPQAQAMAAYLVSSPHANMIGLYHLPMAYAAADLGWTAKATEKAIAKVCASGLADYDEATERVWVKEHARHEFGDGLKLGDHRIVGIENNLKDHLNSFLVKGFLELYGLLYGLDTEGLLRGYEGASEGLRNQEQDQDQEQEQIDIVGPAARLRALKSEIDWRIAEVWKDHLAMRERFWIATNGRAADPPVLTKQLREVIRASLMEHDSERLGADDRERWRRESPVRAAGVGIFLSSWHNGSDPRNNASTGGKRYLEPWRPWTRQRDKSDPVPGFAQNYFQERKQ
jgi:hypothetical protein